MYCVLAATNAELELSEWIPMTNVLTTAGDFALSVTNVMDASFPLQRYFILQTQ
jgi:hypothetical protein